MVRQASRKRFSQVDRLKTQIQRQIEANPKMRNKHIVSLYTHSRSTAQGGQLVFGIDAGIIWRSLKTANQQLLRFCSEMLVDTASKDLEALLLFSQPLD